MPDSLHLFKISFVKFLSAFSLISDLDLDRIANLDINASFDYEIDDLYHCYVLTTEIEVNKYKKILDKNSILYNCMNITDSVIRNQYNISYIENHLDNENYYIYEIFLEDIDKWLYSQLNIDIILDMISLNGIESLRKIDLKFLKENSQN